MMNLVSKLYNHYKKLTITHVQYKLKHTKEKHMKACPAAGPCALKV